MSRTVHAYDINNYTYIGVASTSMFLWVAMQSVPAGDH